MKYFLGYLALLLASASVGLAGYFLIFTWFAFIVLVKSDPKFLRKEVRIIDGKIQLTPNKRLASLSSLGAETSKALGLDRPTHKERDSRFGVDSWQSEGKVDGIPVGFRLIEPRAVEVWVLLEGTLPAGLKLIREPPFAGIARSAGVQDIQLGDEEIDDRFLISGDAESVKALLNREEVRSKLVQVFRKHRSFYIENRRLEISFNLPKDFDPESAQNPIREGIDGLVQLALAIGKADVGNKLSDDKTSTIDLEFESGLDQARERIDGLVQREPPKASSEVLSKTSDGETLKMGMDPIKRFQLLLKEIQPGRSTLWLIVTVNALVFYKMFNRVGEDVLSTSLAYDWGASFHPSLVDGQWWRLFTANYVHFGLSHFASNMVFLFLVAWAIEPLLGRRGFLFLYTITGVFGYLLAAWIGDGITTSAGASGGVFGLFGACCVFVFPRVDIIPVKPRRVLCFFMFLFVCYHLLFGSDNVAHMVHLGGFVSGYVLGIVLSHGLDAKGFASRPARLKKAIIGSSVVLALGVMCFPERPAELVELRKEASSLKQSRLIFSIRDRGRAANTEQYAMQLAEVIRTQVVPKHQEWLSDAESLRSSFSKRWSGEFEAIGWSVYEMMQGWNLVVEGLEASDGRVEGGLFRVEQVQSMLFHP